jgi:hypothetical protein
MVNVVTQLTSYHYEEVQVRKLNTNIHVLIVDGVSVLVVDGIAVLVVNDVSVLVRQLLYFRLVYQLLSNCYKCYHRN